MSWWDDIEALRKANTVVTWVAIGIVPLVLIGANMIRQRISDRISTLASQEQRAREAALQTELGGTHGRLAAAESTLGGYRADLAAKQQEIEALEAAAAKAGRGQYAAWDFNGARREGRAGAIKVVAGEEYGVFQKIIGLEKDGKDAEVVSIATEQIARTPDWLTPYLARGLAFARLGQREKAIEDLEHVVKQAHGDGQYAAAGQALDKLRQR